MTDTNTSDQTPKFNPKLAVHQPFTWLADEVADYPMADFLELTMDICDGVHCCLEIVYLSDLIRSENDDRIAENVELPAVNANDAAKLQRLAIGAIRMLRNSAARKIDWINAHGAEQLQR